MTNTTIEITARNNSDAVRMGNGQIRIPGAVGHKHLGRKAVRIESTDRARTIAWLDASYEVDSYRVTE